MLDAPAATGSDVASPETQNRHEAESDDGGQTNEIAGNRDAGACGHVSGKTLIVDGRGGRETTVSGWNEFLSFAELHFPTLGCDLQQVQQRRGPTWDEIRAAEDRLPSTAELVADVERVAGAADPSPAEPAIASGKIALQAARADRIGRSRSGGPQTAGKRTEQGCAGGCRPTGRCAARGKKGATGRQRRQRASPAGAVARVDPSPSRSHGGPSAVDRLQSLGRETVVATGAVSRYRPQAFHARSDDRNREERGSSQRRRQASRKRPTVPIAVTHRPAVACRRPTRSSTILGKSRRR